MVFISQDVLLLHVAQWGPTLMMAVFRSENDICSIPKWTCQYISFSSSCLMKINQPDQPVPGFLDGSGWLWMVLNGFTMVFGWFWQLADYLQFLKEIVTLSPSQLKGVAVDFPEFLILMPGMPRGCPGDRAKLSRGCLELPSGND